MKTMVVLTELQMIMSVKQPMSHTQMDPKPSSAFIRGGSVSRGFEMSTSRDPFYRWATIFYMQKLVLNLKFLYI